MNTTKKTLLEYWNLNRDGDGAIADGHSEEHIVEAVNLINRGGPWDEEILGPRPAWHPMTW